MKTAASFRHPGVLLAMACLFIGDPARAVTSTGLQNVRAQVNGSCTIAVGTVIAFGNLTATSALAVAQADATGSIVVSCSSGTLYLLAMDGGSNYSGVRRMANGPGQYLTYDIYPSSARTVPLGGSVSASLVSDGTAQTFYAYGRVPAQTAGGSGNFTDTLTFTVTY